MFVPFGLVAKMTLLVHNAVPDTAEDSEGLSGEKNEQGFVNHSLMGTANQRTLSDAGETLDCTHLQMDNNCEDAGLAQETDGLSISPGDKQTTTQDKWKDSCHKDEVTEQEVKPEQPIPQEPLPGRQRRKPTHFICFRVDSPAVLRAYQIVRRKVLTHLPESEPWWVKPESLHVTLALLVLQSPADVFAASELLRSVVKNFYKPPISVSFTPRLRHFNGKVLHVAPQPLSDIQNLNAPFQEAFREKGWLHRDSRDPNYHLTLAKVTDVEAEKMFEDVWRIKLAKDLNFGKLTVDKLYLCVCRAPWGTKGFYETVCSVQLPTV